MPRNSNHTVLYLSLKRPAFTVVKNESTRFSFRCSLANVKKFRSTHEIKSNDVFVYVFRCHSLIPSPLHISPVPRSPRSPAERLSFSPQGPPTPPSPLRARDSAAPPSPLPARGCVWREEACTSPTRGDQAPSPAAPESLPTGKNLINISNNVLHNNVIHD